MKASLFLRHLSVKKAGIYALGFNHFPFEHHKQAIFLILQFVHFILSLSASFLIPTIHSIKFNATPVSHSKFLISTRENNSINY